jgi:HSP20 family protein
MVYLFQAKPDNKRRCWVMKRHVEVRKEAPVKGVRKGHETELPMTHETTTTVAPRGIWTTLEEMERWMEESMHRPFLFDFGFRPISRLLHDLRGEGLVTPVIDVFTEGNEVVVKAELPGMKREEINLRLVDNNLVISGEKQSEEKVERKDYLRLERSYGTFSRTIHLPEGSMTEKTTANFKDGVLEVRVPRSGSGEAKAIRIE